MLRPEPFYSTTVRVNRINSSFGIPAGFYYYHDPSTTSYTLTLLDSDGEMFCRFSDSDSSSIYRTVSFGPNIYFDIGQRDSTEE